MSDRIHVLTATGSLLLTKRIHANGSVTGYGEPKWHKLNVVEVGDFWALSALLTKLESRNQSCVVRGVYIGDAAAAIHHEAEDDYRAGLLLRRKSVVFDQRLHSVMFDVDKFSPLFADPVLEPESAFREYIETHLPAAFHTASFHWQLSSSAGRVGSEGKLKGHLWFWLDTPASSSDLKVWAKCEGLAVDTALFDPIQAHYTAAPVFDEGVPDPVPCRSGTWRGARDAVVIEIANRQSSARLTGVEEVCAADEIAAHLYEKGLVKSFNRNKGGLNITCPNAEQHSGPSGETSTVYVPSGGEFEVGNFICQHEHCRDVPRARFLELLGLGPRPGDASGFDDVEPELVQQVQQQLVAERSVAVQEQREALFEAKERWRSAILAAPDERTLVTVVCPQIAADTGLDSTTRGMLAEALKVTLGKLGSKAGIADCRKLIAPPKREKAKPRDDGHWQARHWTERWVYVTDEDSFYKLDSEEVLSMQSFNAKFNRYLPPADDGEFRKSAAWVALEECSIPTVTRRVYLPWAGPLFELNGVACANSFRPSSMPEIAAEYTPEGLALIDRIKRHVGLLCGGRQDVAEVLLSWMAFQVQQPGKKVRWAPVIKGVQGDGKTLLGRVLSACLGMPNVKIVGPQVLGTSFQDWAHGACVAVLEEIRLSGHNRFEVLDTLKPYVTNNEISIHPKGAKPFDVLNTQNYMAFTNHSDALPIDETDRRWFVIFTPMTSIEDLKNVVGDLGAYFDSIYDPLEKHAGEVRKWMSEMALHPQFQPNGRAMDTDEKASMISMSVSNEDEMLKEAISEGGEGVTEQVVVVSSLLAIVNSKVVDELFNHKTVTLALKKLGWLKVEGQVRWRQKSVRVWVKGLRPQDKDAIRASLDASVDHTCEATDPFA